MRSHLMKSLLTCACLSLLTLSSFAYGLSATDLTFTLDPASISLTGGLLPDDLLDVDSSGALQVRLSAAALGLQTGFPNGPYDTISSFSFGNTYFPSQHTIPVYFSVDRLSTGVPGTAVANEAATGRASAELFTSGSNGQNSLAFPAEALGLQPGFIGDELHGVEFGQPGALIYFTLDSLSASLTRGYQPGDILDSSGNGNSPSIFAPASTLGLGPDDDIASLVLDEINQPGILTPGKDSALFTLSPFSALVLSGSYSSADIYYTDFDGTFHLWSSAANLGLEPDDAIVALMVPEPGPIAYLSVIVVGTACLYWRRRNAAAMRTQQIRTAA